MSVNEIRARGVAVSAGCVASGWALVSTLVFGALRPNYSHVRNYISELGERGGLHAVWVNWIGFVPVGVAVLLFLAALHLVLPVKRSSLALIATTGWAYILSAVFPCDPGCPDQGSTSQMVHNAVALISYVATIVGLWQVSGQLRASASWYRLGRFTAICSIGLAVGFVMMLYPGLSEWRGLSQRVGEVSIFGWIAAVCGRLVREQRSLA